LEILPPAASKSPSVLLLRAGALGDLLLLRPAIAALQRAGRTVGVMAPSVPAAALVGPGHGDVVEALPSESVRFAGLFADGRLDDASAAERLRSYDVAIAYTRDAALVRNLGRLVPTVLQHDPAPPPKGAHAGEWLASCLPAIGVSAASIAVPVLTPSEEDQARAHTIAADLPSGFLAIHPGSGSPAKNWPAARFASLARAAGGPRFLLVRGPADDDAACELETLPEARVARDLPLRVLAALLARAGAYVGNDSGVTHLAAAGGAPTIALFGPTDPAIWAPLGPRVRILRADGMDGIAVEDVAAAVRECDTTRAT
jgi:heptosyltransferase-2